MLYKLFLGEIEFVHLKQKAEAKGLVLAPLQLLFVFMHRGLCLSVVLSSDSRLLPQSTKALTRRDSFLITLQNCSANEQR